MNYLIFLLFILDFCIFSSVEKVDEILINKAFTVAQQAKDKADEYQQSQDNELFKEACKQYQQACDNYQKAYDVRNKNGKNTQEIEDSMSAVRKEFFLFMLPNVMDLYLPSPEDQSVLKGNLALFKDEKEALLLMLEVAESVPEGKQCSRVDNFICAYIYEFLGDSISAAQNYLLLSKKYFQYKFPVLSAKCLEKAECLIIKESKKESNPLCIANFLENLDRNWLSQLYHLNNDDYNGYLEKILQKKDAIRAAFNKSLYELKKHSTNEEPRCFICFNVEETDVQEWLSNTLVPDIERVGVKTIFAPKALKIGADLNNFQGQIRDTEFAIIACTPLLKKKFGRRIKAPAGSTLEIKLALERFKDPEKYETTYLIYLKGDHQSSCPSVFLEPFFGKKLNISGKNTDFNYYSHTLNFFAWMRRVNEEKFKKIEGDFKSEVEKNHFL